MFNWKGRERKRLGYVTDEGTCRLVDNDNVEYHSHLLL
jgi:hypothetical protein